MIRTFIGLFILIYLSILCNCGVRKNISIPDELCNLYNLSLGEESNKIIDQYKMEFDNSCSCYIGHIDNCSYFETLFIESSGKLNIFNSEKIQLIQLTHQSLADEISLANDSTDNLAREIIDLCILNFGDKYVITDGGYKNTKPEIIWYTDSCYVTFLYTPSSLFEKLISNQKHVSCSRVLTLGYHNDTIEKKIKTSSAIWTKKSLGLE